MVSLFSLKIVKISLTSSLSSEKMAIQSGIPQVLESHPHLPLSNPMNELLFAPNTTNLQC